MDAYHKTIAAIDLGSNSAHMVIADMDAMGAMRILDQEKVTLRLGEGYDEAGNLTETAIAKTVEAFSHMQEIIQPYGAVVRAVATHATREAKNHRQLIRAIAAKTGLHLELIDGIEEARLVFLGMRYGLPLAGMSCLGVDVGGGSTEIIVARDDDIRQASSVKMGAVTLTSHFFRNGYSQSALANLREHVRTLMAPLGSEVRHHEFTKALASSGTAKALAVLHAQRCLGLAGGASTGGKVVAVDDGLKTPKEPNGYVVTREELSAILGDLTALLTPAKIRLATGLDQNRAEIIVAGLVILDEFTRLLRIKEWVITSYGLREGLVADTFYRLEGPQSRNPLADVQGHSIRQFGRRLGVSEPHAAQVARLAERLYDQLVPVLRAEDGDSEEDRQEFRRLLRAAAYLRECGKFLSAPHYHRHSQYLIAHCRLPGFTESERWLMGLIARFQRKGLPSANHPACADMGPDEVRRLRLLAGMVRLAAALDRTRQGRILEVTVDWRALSKADRRLLRSNGKGPKLAGTITLLHDDKGPPEVELHKAHLEQAALEKSWGVALNFAARALRAESSTP